MASKQKVTMWSALAILVVLLTGVVCAWYFGQTRLIFPATRTIDRTPASEPFCWDYEEVFLDVAGRKTHAWFVPLHGASMTVLFSHGNAGNIAGRLESIQLLRSMGFSVLAYDYGGYGLSTGGASEQRVYRDVEAAWAYLTETRGIEPSRIVLFGRSLGGAATAYLAARVTPAAVVLESTFCSIPAVVRDMPLGRFLAKGIRHRFPTIDRVPLIRAPLLVIHSREDSLIPFKHGKAIFDAAPEPKTFLEIRGDHDMGFVESMDAYKQGWQAFFAGLPD